MFHASESPHFSESGVSPGPMDSSNNLDRQQQTRTPSLTTGSTTPPMTRSSPCSVTNTMSARPTGKASPVAPPVQVIANPFEDPEILRSVGVEMMPSSHTAAPTSSSMSSRSADARPPRQHRASKTLCTSELSSIAGQAAATATTTTATIQVDAGMSSPGRQTPISSPSSPHHYTPLAQTQTNSETAKALSELAGALSSLRPRCNKETEEEEESAAMARITLGITPEESTGTPKTHRRTIGASKKQGAAEVDKNVKLPKSIALKKGHRRTGSFEKAKAILSSPTISKSPHRKAKSLGVTDMMSIVDSINEAGGGKKETGREKTGLSARASLVLGGKRSPRGSRSSAEKTETSPTSTVADKEPATSRRDEHRARLADIYKSETSLFGTEFIPSMPDLDALLEADDDATGINTNAEIGESENHVNEKDGIESLPNGGGAEDWDDGNEEDDTAIKNVAESLSMRDTVSNLPPQAAIFSDTLPSMRSSELDPTPFQLQIVPVVELQCHAKLCNALEEYHTVDQNFDYSRLAGISRLELERFVEGESRLGLEPAHHEIVSTLLECGDDVVLEGFVHEIGSCSKGDAQDDTGTARDKASDDRVEVAIFYSAKLRQFIVVWRGPTDDQVKPVRNRNLKAAKEMLTRDPRSADLSEEQRVSVFPAYRYAYFRPAIEQKVFDLLEKLTDETPFCDVVMTGHSFGSALATIAAARYASSRHQIRVCASLFGSPKVGAVNFRHWVNSLPNLKIMRIEYASDPWTNAPEGLNWSHVGHTIVLNLADIKKAEKSSANTSLVKAYRFDQCRPQKSPPPLFLSSVAKRTHHGGKSQRKNHMLSEYAYAIDRIVSLRLPWVSAFVGEDSGDGVVGNSDQEKRLFV